LEIAVYFRIVVIIILLFIAFPYAGYMTVKTKEKIPKLIYLVITVIFASFAMIIILWDPNWGAPILTVGLLIVTLVYAQSNQQYVDLIENERKGKRIAEISRSIFSEMENLIDEIFPILDTGETIHSLSPFSSILKDYFRPNRILKETIPIKSDKIDVEFSSNQIVGYCYAESMLRSGDDILKEYLPKVQNLCDNYEWKN
jgi:c-di-AMP phosphodiesterase-like protein